MQLALPTDVRIQAIACLMVGMVSLSAQDAIIKWLSGTYPLHQIVFSRASVAVALTLVAVHFEGGMNLLKTRRPTLHVIRGLLLVLANMAYFTALASMPLAEATAIFFVAPLFITILSIPLLGEKVGPRRWLAVTCGLAGVVVMLRPGDGAIQTVALLPVIAALAYASMQMITRKLGLAEKASVMAFYVQLMFLLVSGLIGLTIGSGRFAEVVGSGNPSLEFLFRAWRLPDQGDALLLLLCGVLVAIGAYMLSQAYRLTEATVVAPFEYSALPLTVMWGALLWGDWPDSTALVGITLIVGGGLYVFYRETVQGHPVAAERPMPRNR